VDPLEPTDAICGTNLLNRAQQSLAVDTLQFGRFEELCTFLELFVLCENIYYFAPAPLSGKLSRTFPQVLRNLDSEAVEELIRNSSLEHDFDSLLKHVFRPTAPALRVDRVLVKGTKRRLDDDLILDYRGQVVRHFAGQGPTLFDWLLKLPTESGDLGVEARYFFRAFLYEAASRTLGVTVAHDALRTPISVAANLISLRPNFALYWALVNALRPELSKNSLKLYLRPIPCVILKRCRGNKADILQQAAQLRENFRTYRQSILEFETLQLSRASIGEKQEATDLIVQSVQLLVDEAQSLRKNKRWLSDLASRFLDSTQRNHTTSISGAVSQSVATLLKSEYSWDAKSRLAPLFGLIKELAETESYPRFIEEIWPSTPFARAHPFHTVLNQCKNASMEPI